MFVYEWSRPKTPSFSAEITPPDVVSPISKIDLSSKYCVGVDRRQELVAAWHGQDYTWYALPLRETSIVVMFNTVSGTPYRCANLD